MGKCKFWKQCKLYNKESIVCEKDNGFAYPNKHSGCYREIEELQNSESTNGENEQ